MENQKSLIELALEVMEETSGPINIYELIQKTLAKKGIQEDPNFDYAAKLYTDIIISSKFVFLGDDNWDLKSRQSLDEFDKDGSSFAIKDAKERLYEEDEDEEDDIDIDEDSDDEDSDDDYDDESDDEEDDIEIDDYDDESDDEEDDSYDDRDLDEETYNKIMDDYEDLYDN